MKIAIDARVLERKITGVGRYLLNILNEIQNYDSKNEYLLLSKEPLEISNNNFRNIATGGSAFHEKIFSSYWLNFILPGYLKKEKVNLFFSPNHLLPVKKLENIKTVIAVHDVFHKINKNYHPASYTLYLDLLLANSIKKSDSIITVSNNSKKDIVNIFNIPEQKIHVIYEHADEKFAPMEVSPDVRSEIFRKYNIPAKKIILYVGLIENRKNIRGILKIADILHGKKLNFNVILVGRAGYGFLKIHEEIKLRSNYVTYLDYIDEKTLKVIYNLADVFVFPSYYEGFGLPPLEAMQSGVPVLSSNTSSLPEVVGEGGIMHDPDNHEAFANDIERLLIDFEFRQKMKGKAITQAKKFSKETSMQKLVNVFEDLS